MKSNALPIHRLPHRSSMPYNPAIHRDLSMEECQALLSTTHSELVRDYPQLTPRSLDHEIWLYQRQSP